MRFFYSILRKFNDGVPTRSEIHYCYHVIMYDLLPLSPKILRSMKDYFEGQSLEQIGNSYHCTRERIRQHLMKGCRVAYYAIR